MTPDNCSSLPLVVDLDGTLIATDTLWESVIHMLRRSPALLFLLPLWLLSGRARFKAAVAARSALNGDRLPYREPLLSYLRDQRSDGRRLVLATAAHHSVAERVQASLGLFDDVLASTEHNNLKGAAKLRAIQSLLGPEFVYAGDSRADIPVWRGARAAVLVNAPPRVATWVRRHTPVEREFPRQPLRLQDAVKALRVHQWLKNVLLLVPMFTAFMFSDLDAWSRVLVAFLAFSLVASATYVVNDLLDIESDRAHPRKRLRPIPSGALPIQPALMLAAVSLTLGFAAASFVSPEVMAWLAVYLVTTSAYSWVLKRYVLLDVLTLSLLYTLRIQAGAAAVGVHTSSWLLAFSVFLFCSLALIKRCAELVTLRQLKQTGSHGRDYRVDDLAVLWSFGGACSVAAIVVFGLYIDSPETRARYASPSLLWFAGACLMYWLGRLWIKTSRGEMHDDPLLYAVYDRGGRIAMLAMLVIILVSHFWGMPWQG